MKIRADIHKGDFDPSPKKRTGSAPAFAEVAEKSRSVTVSRSPPFGVGLTSAIRPGPSLTDASVMPAPTAISLWRLWRLTVGLGRCFSVVG
jgi:hypothetical protein